MAKRQCKGKTKKGTPCKAAPLKDSDFCLAHADEETRESTGFGGSQPGAGRPRQPRAIEVIRERIEQDIEQVVGPLFEALEAERGVVVGAGENATLEMVADWSVRLSAIRELLDRGYGKPRQTIAHTGVEDGPPIGVELSSDLADAAHEFLDRVRRGRG